MRPRRSFRAMRRMRSNVGILGPVSAPKNPLPRRHLAIVASFGLISAVVLASLGAISDSITVDEPGHLVAGYAPLVFGDHRLSPDQSPLARLLFALPLLTDDIVWPPEPSSPAGPAAETAAQAAWRSGDFLTFGRLFCETFNDGQKLIRSSRGVAVTILVALLVTVGTVARSRFGAIGGTVALLVAAFDPALLAHGHLVTTDVPFALSALLVLVTADRWLVRPSPARLAVAALAFAAATLVKLSWLTIVPALLAMAIAARRDPDLRTTCRNGVRTIMFGAGAFAITSYLAIWAVYGFHFRAARGVDAEVATMHVLGDVGQPLPTNPAAAWESVLHDPATGRDRRGLAAPLLRWAYSKKLLPEGYLYGLAYVAKKGMTRAAYLRGEYSMSGFRSYFGWAFALKTPLPTIVLFGLGLAAAFVRWRERQGRPASASSSPSASPLAWGFATFTACYLATLVSSALNLGYRHLLPITPLLAIAAGGVWPWLAEKSAEKSKRGQVAVVGLLLWLGVTTCVASPHLLGYFNETVGGWRNGHRFLVESNLDWGQDLLRLEERLRHEPRETTVWIAQAGDPPLPRGLSHRGLHWLRGKGSHMPSPEPMTSGLYVVSATELLGVYQPLARVETWRDPRWITQYEQLAQEARFRPTVATNEPDAFEALRRLRLIARLSQREPDERVGTSLFLFRLSDAQIAEATEP